MTTGGRGAGGGADPRDEGGDPACWAHLFTDEVDEEPPVDEPPGAAGTGSGDELDHPPGAPLLAEPADGVVQAPVVAHDVGQEVAEAPEVDGIG